MYGISPTTTEAREWVEENVALEPWQWLGDAFWSDTRSYMEAIMGGLQEAGLVLGADFETITG